MKEFIRGKDSGLVVLKKNTRNPEVLQVGGDRKLDSPSLEVFTSPELGFLASVTSVSFLVSPKRRRKTHLTSNGSKEILDIILRFYKLLSQEK